MKNYPLPLLVALAVCMAMFSTCVMAQAADWLVVSGASWHFEKRYQYRAENPGLGWERNLDEMPLSVMAGFYLNSYNRETVYAGARWEPFRWSHARLGLFGGVASGYWTPVVTMPILSLEYRRVGINIMAVPTIGEYIGCFGAQLKFRFD